MADDDFDPFALSTGLPDKLDVVIDEAWFEFDPQYNDGQTLLLKFNVTANDDEFGEHGKGTLQYGCGTGWTAADRGARAERDDGAKKGFNQSSAYGLFIAAALNCDGAENVLRGEGRGDPRLASMWTGLSWHLDRKERDYGGDIGKVSRLLPTQFLGEGGGGGATKPAGPAKKAAGPVSKGPGAGGGTGPQKAAGPTKAAPVKKAAPAPATQAVDELPPEDGGGEWGPGVALYDELFAIALAAPDHETFMEQAFNNVEGVAGDGDVEAAVMDTSDTSLWQAAVAAYEASQGS